MGDEIQCVPLHGSWDSNKAPSLDVEFEALVKKYGRFMSDVARTVLSGYGCSNELVKEVVQDALFAVYKDFQRGTVVENQLAYLRTVTARRAINVARTLNRRNEFEIEDEENTLSRKISSYQCGQDRIYELRIMYNSLWNTLSDAQRVIFDMWLDGMTGHEIGEVMGISRAHVNVTIHRIRRKFQPLAQYLNR